jgi:enoyl-CoA hydratase/carnithine racemase
MTAKELRDIARRSLDNMGVTGARYRVEEMLEWKVADRIEALEEELAASHAEVERLRALVEEAFLEGGRTAGCKPWEQSDAKKAL